MTTFPTEFLFSRLSDFWDFFKDREDVKNAWDGYTRKGQALNSLLRQANLSKSLATLPIFDRNDLEYFVFPNLVRRNDQELNGPFYSFEIDPTIFFIKDLHEKIDDVTLDRLLTPPNFYHVRTGTGADAGTVFLDFFRGVEPASIGQTFWTQGSDLVVGTGTTFLTSVEVGDIIQGYDRNFYKVAQLLSDTQLKIQGATKLGESVGQGNGAQTVFQLAATANVIVPSAQVFFNGALVPSASYTVTPQGLLTFLVAPSSSVSAITASYYLGYPAPTVTNRSTAKESIPTRLLSRGVYRDRKTIFTNFGTAIGINKPTSFQYLNEVRGIYFARYNGPTNDNMTLGAGILIGLPFAPAGQVNQIATSVPKSVTVNQNLIQVPAPLTITVAAGQKLTRDFSLLTTGVRTADFINAPDIFGLAPLVSNPEKFFTFYVVVSGAYATYVATQTGQPIDYTQLLQFIADIKPTYTKAMVLTNLDFLDEKVGLFVGPVGVTDALDAAPTLEFNLLNFAIHPAFLAQNGFADEAALVLSGLVNMDLDSVGIYEGLGHFYDALLIDTLVFNLPNFQVPFAPPNMDDDTVILQESLQIHTETGGIPGALLYSWP